jgi:hypothetical protein
MCERPPAKRPRRLAESLATYLPDDGAGVAKVSISLPKDLFDDVRTAADEHNSTISATIAAALRKAGEPDATEGESLKRVLPGRHWFALIGLAQVREQSVEEVLAEAVDAWLASQGVRLVRDEAWRRGFTEFLARRSALAEQNEWTDEEIRADVDATVRESRAARRP